MTNDELRATVARAVHRLPSAFRTDIANDVIDALAPLVVTEPEPVRSVTLASGTVITYRAGAAAPWHWVTRAAPYASKGYAEKLAYICPSDDELAACLALREPLADGWPEIADRQRKLAEAATLRAHVAERKLRDVQAVLEGKP